MKKMPPMSPSMLLLIEDLFSPEWNKLDAEENNDGLTTEKTERGTDKLKSSGSEDRPQRKLKLRLVKSPKRK